jgi:lysozyme
MHAAELIKHFAVAHCEDILSSHRNPYDVLAIGYGHTRGAMEGQTITQAQADDILASDIDLIEKELHGLLFPAIRREMNANQTAAIVSFAHSLGMHIFKQTCVLARLNTRRYCDVPAELSKWDSTGTRPLRILARRRLSEGNLFCSFPNWLATK